MSEEETDREREREERARERTKEEERRGRKSMDREPRSCLESIYDSMKLGTLVLREQARNGGERGEMVPRAYGGRFSSSLASSPQRRFG